MKKLKKEMISYYKTLRFDTLKETILEADRVAREKVINSMEELVRNRPDLSAVTLKAYLQEYIADNFNPVIFPDSPFFFEMGMRFSENWGTPQEAFKIPASWLFKNNSPMYMDNVEAKDFTALNLHGCQEKLQD